MAPPERIATLRQSMEEHKHELRLAVDELRIAARMWTDPRDAVREHPAVWLGGGLLLGLWLGWDR
jgi:hypothetical protein